MKKNTVGLSSLPRESGNEKTEMVNKNKNKQLYELIEYSCFYIGAPTFHTGNGSNDLQDWVSLSGNPTLERRPVILRILRRDRTFGLSLTKSFSRLVVTKQVKN